MSNRRNLLALILVLCMVCSMLAGCGGSSGDNSGTSSSDGSTASNKETQGEANPGETANPEDGPLTPYAETLVITQVRDDPEAVTYLEGESPDHNFVRDFYKEKLNIEYQTLWNSSDYYTKLNLDIASNTLPDVFRVNSAQLQTLIQNGQIEDLTSSYQNYASDLLKKHVEYGGGISLEGCTVDGVLYGIPIVNSSLGNTGFMCIREDWRKQLGLEAPTTWQEFLDYVKALKESGLCADNSSGFSFLGVNSIPFNSIAQVFGAYYNYFIEDESGQLVYSSVTENMRNALLAMQDMYKNGLIDVDWASKGYTEEELVSRGTYGVLFGQWGGGPYTMKGSVINDDKAEWEVYPMPVYDENTITKPAADIPLQGYVVVRKGFEHPEALVKTMNMWAEINCSGGQYVDWWVEQISGKYSTVNLVGNYMLPYTMEGVTTGTDIGDALEVVFASDNPDEEIKKYPIATYTYNMVKDPSNPDYLTGNGWWLNIAYRKCAAKVWHIYEDRGLQYNLFQGVLSEDSLFNKTALDTTMAETFTNIIMGESIESFDAFVTQWYEQGGEEILKEANEWYSSR